MLPSLKRWGRWPQVMDILPTHPYASQEATARWGATTHKETPAEHTPGHTGPSSPTDIIHLQRNHFHEGKKPKTQVSTGEQWTAWICSHFFGLPLPVWQVFQICAMATWNLPAWVPTLPLLFIYISLRQFIQQAVILSIKTSKLYSR